jgi:hypothetical protein
VRRFEAGDRVRVEIPDQMDPDFDRYHNRKGTVVEIIEDDAGEHTGDERTQICSRSSSRVELPSTFAGVISVPRPIWRGKKHADR